MQREYLLDQADAVRERSLFNHVRRALFITRASEESDCESELSPAFLLPMLSTQLTQKIIPVYATRSSSQFSLRCSITRNPILDCIHHAVFRRTSDGYAFLNKLLTTGTKTH